MMRYFARRLLDQHKRCVDLERSNRNLMLAFREASDKAERLRRRNGQLERDFDLLALMAADRKTALEFIRTAHEIDAR